MSKKKKKKKKRDRLQFRVVQGPVHIFFFSPPLRTDSEECYVSIIEVTLSSKQT